MINYNYLYFRKLILIIPVIYEINEILTNFEYPYNELCIKSNEQLILDYIQENEKLLNILQNKDCVSSFKIKKDKYIVYRKRK